jgi:hypothetical protein
MNPVFIGVGVALVGLFGLVKRQAITDSTRTFFHNACTGDIGVFWLGGERVELLQIDQLLGRVHLNVRGREVVVGMKLDGMYWNTQGDVLGTEFRKDLRAGRVA